MALRFCDSFDHYAAADRLKKWTSDTTGNAPQISAGNGRHGSNSLRQPSTNTGLVKTLSSSEATWIVGFAFRTTTLVTNTFFQFRDSGTIHAELRLLDTGALRVMRNGTTLATGSILLSANVFYYIEFKCLIADSGTYEVHVNGVQDASLTGSGDTRNAANASANQICLLQGAGAGTYDYDDLYLCDINGGVNDDFLGDVRVEAIFPDGNGNSSDLVGSDADSTDNYLLVDETAPNDDTDFVQGSVIGDKDTYTYENLSPGSGTVYGVQLLPYARKTDAGVRSIASVARLSATEEDSSDKALSTSYAYYPDIRQTKPGGGAWSITDVNNAEFGVKVTA